MRKIVLFGCGLLIMHAAVTAAAQELDPRLEMLEPLLGTWEGTFHGEGAPPEEVKDRVTYTIALNGQAVKSTHTVGGAYGGDSYYMWNPVLMEVQVYYFTNAGTISQGTVTLKDGVMHSKALHYGGSTSAWRATTEFTGDDSFTSTAEYLQAGEWKRGHSVSYIRVTEED
jgi:hypothetical protein